MWLHDWHYSSRKCTLPKPALEGSKDNDEVESFVCYPYLEPSSSQYSSMQQTHYWGFKVVASGGYVPLNIDGSMYNK